MVRRKEKSKRFRMKPTIEELAIEILHENNKPMSYKDIWSKVSEKHPLGENTPEKTIYSILFRSKKFRLLGNGVFDLRSDNDS